MTQAEKKTIFNLLKTADSWASGYADPEFKAEDYIFEDDVEAASPIQDSQAADASQTTQPTQTTQAVFTQETAPASQTPDQEQPAVPEKKGATLESVAQKIQNCHNCVLCQKRTNVVPGEGVQAPAVMVIGEGPGEEEDITGRPFVGKAGQLLDKMLGAISLDRECNCFIANIVKCRPPMNRTPMKDEAAACSGYLDAQIHILKPKMILAMGRTAVQNLMQTEQGINSLRGKIMDYNGIPLLATYHPSALLRDESLKGPAWNDLKLFRSKLKEICPDYDQTFDQKHKKQ